MELKDKNCTPHRSYVPPLSIEEKKELLLKLNQDWDLVSDSKKLSKKFHFKNFKDALEFTNEIGQISENQQHHPDIHLSWGLCIVEIWTHVNNDLLENDFIMAAKFDEVYKMFKERS